MILTILNLLLVSPLIWVPLFFYGRHSRFMVKFCQRMARSEYYRKIYCISLLVLVLMFHATYPELYKGHFGIYASTLLAISITFKKWTMHLLEGIRASKSVMTFVGLVALANAFGTGMYTLGVTLGYILLAAIFYPSSSMKEYVLEETVYSNYEELEKETVKHYFA